MSNIAKAVARVPTASGSRYLQQLAKHWSHKFPVAFDPLQGRIELPLGLALLRAEPGILVVELEAQDADSLPRMKEVVASHLDRFAFREAPLLFDWG